MTEQERIDLKEFRRLWALLSEESKDRVRCAIVTAKEEESA